MSAAFYTDSNGASNRVTQSPAFIFNVKPAKASSSSSGSAAVPAVPVLPTPVPHLPPAPANML